MNIDSLKRAFSDIYATMDDMATYKVKALENMKQTVDVLNGEVHKAQVARAYLKKAKPAAGLFPTEHIPTRLAALRQRATV